MSWTRKQVTLLYAIGLVWLFFALLPFTGAQSQPSLIVDMDWSSDDSLIAVGYMDSLIKIVDPDTQEVYYADTLMPGASVTELEWSQTDNILAAAAWSGPVRLIDATDNFSTAEMSHRGRVEALSWHPGGIWLASVEVIGTGSGRTSIINIWDTSSLQLVNSDEWYGVTDIDWSYDGSLLAFTSEYQGTGIYDPFGETSFLALSDSAESAVAWNPQLEVPYLAIGDYQGHIQIWHSAYWRAHQSD